MNSSGRTRTDMAMRETTKRVALKLAGGAAVTGSPEALAASGGWAGKCVVIRLRQPNPDWLVEEVRELIGERYVATGFETTKAGAAQTVTPLNSGRMSRPYASSVSSWPRAIK
jgi:hypothetical protein